MTLEHVATRGLSQRGGKVISKATLESHKRVGKNNFGIKLRTGRQLDLGGDTTSNSSSSLSTLNWLNNRNPNFYLKRNTTKLER